MSMNVQAAPASEIATKWELAVLLAGEEKAPEKALKCVFDKAMLQLEDSTNTKFEISMKERVWNTVSPEKLKTLRNAFLQVFWDKMFVRINEYDFNGMLNEHISLGDIKNIRYKYRLERALLLLEKPILKAVNQKANSMVESWIPEIIDAVKKEGIELPEPHNLPD